MALRGKSLNAATTTGAGTAITFDTPRSALSLQATVTGSPSLVTVLLEGSIDGSTFHNMNAGLSDSGLVGANILTPVIALRANVTQLAGGSSPTVTAWVAAGD